MLNKEPWDDADAGSEPVDETDSQPVALSNTAEAGCAVGEHSHADHDDGDDDHDVDDDDDDYLSEEQQRHAAVRFYACTEIRRAIHAGDWRAAVWFLRHNDEGLSGPYCRACRLSELPYVGEIRTPEARAAAKFLDDDERRSWGSRCLRCGQAV